jgi:hypothetical protein
MKNMQHILYVGIKKYHKFLLESLTRGDHMRDLGIDAKIMFKWILEGKMGCADNCNVLSQDWAHW